MQFVNPTLGEFVGNVKSLSGGNESDLGVLDVWANGVHTTVLLSNSGQITKEVTNGTLRLTWHTSEAGNVSVLVCLIDANGDIQT